MSISVGGINLVEAIINLDYELGRTQRILDWVVSNNQLKMPDQEALNKINSDAMKALQIKYPAAGIESKEK